MPKHYSGNKKKTTKKTSTKKKAPAGYHFMPSGKLMKNGKHKGKKPEDVPLGYLIWMYKKTDCPSCVLKALKEVKNLF